MEHRVTVVILPLSIIGCVLLLKMQQLAEIITPARRFIQFDDSYQ
ncbi:MAG: hypothetical protein ACWA6V_07420 [Cellvibrio sp.]